MTAPESKLATVRKLLAKAERAATPAEAEVYTAKAIELMARHGIDDALLAATGEKADEIRAAAVAMANPYSREKASLLTAIATTLRCRTVLSYRGSARTIHTVRVLGFASDLQRVEILYTSLLLQATTQVVHQRPRWSDESVAAYRRSWLMGFTAAVHTRLQRAEAEAEAAAAAARVRRTDGSSTTGALVLVDRHAQVERAFEDAYGHLGTVKSRKLTGSGGFDGYAAGERADLSLGRRVERDHRREIGA